MLEVCVAIIRENEKYLICQRSKDDYFSNIWEFPGGKKEENESSEECIKREICEELEINIEIEKLFAELIHEVKGRNLLFKFFLARKDNKELVLNVHQDYKWVRAGELTNFPFMEADVTILKKLKELEN